MEATGREHDDHELAGVQRLHLFRDRALGQAHQGEQHRYQLAHHAQNQRTGRQTMNVQVRLPGTEHWTNKGHVKLLLWNTVAGVVASAKGAILCLHVSSLASQPPFYLDVRGRPDSSAMEYLSRQGYDTWCV